MNLRLRILFWSFLAGTRFNVRRRYSLSLPYAGGQLAEEPIDLDAAP